MKLSDFDFNLPKEFIAQEPLKDRSSSKLLVLDKDNRTMEHKVFEEFINYLNPGDCLVLYNTRVLPASNLNPSTPYS
jgi:S-adenosylmethionine:tRNA ribosyltransferase-isomerase